MQIEDVLFADSILFIHFALVFSKIQGDLTNITLMGIVPF